MSKDVVSYIQLSITDRRLTGLIKVEPFTEEPGTRNKVNFIDVGPAIFATVCCNSHISDHDIFFPVGSKFSRKLILFNSMHLDE